MVYMFTGFGAEESTGIGALGVNGSALLIQLITFLLAYFVLRKYAFKPILKILADRRQTIESGLTLGEELQKERDELERKVKTALSTARKQADTIVAEAQDAAREAIRAAESKASEKADGILADAHTRAEQDIVRMRTALEAELVSLVSDATEAIIDEKLDGKKDAALISRSLKEQQAA
jgi:F-type H+-transporting ATPase subunit b